MADRETLRRHTSDGQEHARAFETVAGCPVCGRVVGVDKRDGVLTDHGVIGRECPGSGRAVAAAGQGSKP